MASWPSHPVVFEINTWVWLDELGAAGGLRSRPGSLDSVPDEVWDATLPPTTDAVWLMGVWERSAIGAEISRQRFAGEPVEPDVIGSAYCIRDYRVDPRLGGDAALAVAREALARRGIRLVLDYVPNHVAPDHPWVAEGRDVFVAGNGESGHDGDVELGGRWLALGRDPYFPPWRDVVQLHAFRPELRRAALEVLDKVAGQCDGVRCDMAMLFLDDVFESTWGRRAGAPLPDPYWRSLIASVKRDHPDFAFIAEAYWDLEWALMEEGFDACYDKRLYDRLAAFDTTGVRAHLTAESSYQRRLVRFLENHDEPRAALTWTGSEQRAAAIVCTTLPGWLLLYEGQLDGRRSRPPVELGRRETEAPDAELRRFYERLLPVAAAMWPGEWRLCATSGWPDNPTHQRLLAWTWTLADRLWLVVVNFAPTPSQARVVVDWPGAAGHPVRAVDTLTGNVFDREANELSDPGLYVKLDAWQAHVLEWTVA